MKFPKSQTNTVLNNHVPGPGTYNPINCDLQKAPRAVFGNASSTPQNDLQKNPGPGTYDPKTQPNNDIKFSFPKSGTQSEKKNLLIGPGSYDPQFEFNSTAARKPGAVFGSEQRCKVVSKGPVPGPGQYEPQSKSHRQAQSWGFGKEKRNSLSYKHVSPGPGAYQLNSSFNVKEGLIRGPVLRSRPQSASPTVCPGPGAYDSRVEFARPNSPLINFSKANRFLQQAGNPIGPGDYNGKVPKKNYGTVLFGKDKRFQNKNLQTCPGPGSYDSKPLIKTIAYTMRPKTASEKSEAVPGPGAYNPNTS